MAAKSRSAFRAGAGQADITPAMGIQIAGDIGRYRPVEEIRDPLYAKALAVEADGKRTCLVQFDLLSFIDPQETELRNRAAERFDLDPDSILFHVVQNHAAPCLGHDMLHNDYSLPDSLWFLRGGDDRYNPVAIDGILKAMESALASLQPVTLAIGRGIDGRVAFNRRFIMRDGTGRTHPSSCDPNILCCEGPIDPEVGVMTFTGRDGQAIAALLHHTCHPVHGCSRRWISAGWPGAWADGVKKQLGSDCVPLVLNGFCGNIHHCNHLVPDQKDDYQEMGKKLTETTERVLKTLTPMKSPLFDWRTRHIAIPTRKLKPADIAAARKIIKANPKPPWTDKEKTAIHWDWVYAHATLDLAQQQRRCSTADCRIQVFRIGDLGLVAAPGEPFVEEQLRIKRESKAPFTWAAHMCGSYSSYVPTREAFLHGGYETRTANWSMLDPCALELYGDTALSLLKALFKSKPAS